jgi:hypothetical protein
MVMNITEVASKLNSTSFLLYMRKELKSLKRFNQLVATFHKDLYKYWLNSAIM